jgi:beta-glucosidase
VDGIAPKLVVLKIGTNNLYNDFNAGSDEEIAKGIDAIVNLLREKLPATKVLLLAVLPRQNEYFCSRIRKINAIMAKLDEGKGVRFLDMTDRFQDAPGKVKADLFNKDQLHLEKKGYEVWAEAMDSVLDELMK